MGYGLLVAVFVPAVLGCGVLSMTGSFGLFVGNIAALPAEAWRFFNSGTTSSIEVLSTRPRVWENRSVDLHNCCYKDITTLRISTATLVRGAAFRGIRPVIKAGVQSFVKKPTAPR